MKRTLVALVLIVLTGVCGYFAFVAFVRGSSFPEGLIQANGRIEADHVTIASKFSGRVVELRVHEGDWVKCDQVVARLDDTQTVTQVEQSQQSVAALEAQVMECEKELALLEKQVPLEIAAAESEVAHRAALVARAKATEKQKEKDAERYKGTAKKGASSVQEKELAELASVVAKTEINVCEAALRRAQDQLELAKLGFERIAAKKAQILSVKAKRDQAMAALQESKSILNDLVIKAPQQGAVTTRIANLGETISPGAPLYDIVDLDMLYLKVYVGELNIGKLRLGLPAQVYTDAFPDAPFGATVRYISPAAEFTPKEVQTPDERVKLVYAVKLYLDENPDHRLTPGLPADAVIRWKQDAPWAKPRW